MERPNKPKDSTKGEGLSALVCLAFVVVVAAVLLLCICAGSVSVPLGDTLGIIWRAIAGQAQPQSAAVSIILSVRLPRVLCVALVGSMLSLSGAAMQGLLKNPLADGSTLGVSSGASLGAVLAIATGFTLPGLTMGGTVISSIFFAFISLLLILTLAYRLDRQLSTNTIILMGVIYSMFTSSIIQLIITFAADKVKQITFWTMGTLQGSSYANALLLLCALLVFGTVILCLTRELNAFAIGEENARHVGVNVKRVKLLVLVCVSALIGVCVSVSGTIGFVGLVVPHMVRMITGPNHRRLLPVSLLGGAAFLMLCDLVARVILSPHDLPIGVVTSFIGAILFVFIFFRTRRARA